MPFVTGQNVLVRQFDDEHWTLQEPVVYQGPDETFTVPKGTLTDFASVPRVFAWLVPKYGVFTAAAVLHDHLTHVEVPAGRIRLDAADALFRRAMHELGVSFLLRWFMWGAVRWAALSSPTGRDGWGRELPRLLLVTVVALPVVAVPAVAIAVGLAVFVLLEFAVYWLLLLRCALRPGPHPGVARPQPGMRT